VITPGDERARAGDGPAFTDAVTFAWGDAGAGLYGLARIGLGGGGDGGRGDGGGDGGDAQDGGREASALAVLFAGREPVGALARGGTAVAADADFASLDLPGLSTAVTTPLRAWTVAFAGTGCGFELVFEALGAPVELDPAEPLARVGGMCGYEQLCLVHGTVRVGDAEHAVRCLGQRSHGWGEPDWERLEATRTISAWLDDGTAIALATVRPGGARGHDEEIAWGAILDPAGSVHVDDPRLSTTYDADGRQRRAGLELWLDEPDGGAARRAAGEVVCGSTLDLGALRLDAAVFRWHMNGRSGIGRYDILRRA
jgi:hypothetical protein